MEGTVALNHTQSQTDMMMNKALFIPNGNWMENEMKDAPRADGFEFGLWHAPVLNKGDQPYVMTSVEQFSIPAAAEEPRAGEGIPPLPLHRGFRQAVCGKVRRHLRAEGRDRMGQGVPHLRRLQHERGL